MCSTNVQIFLLLTFLGGFLCNGVTSHWECFYYTEDLSLLLSACTAQRRVTPGCPAEIRIGDLQYLATGRRFNNWATPRISTNTELRGTPNTELDQTTQLLIYATPSHRATPHPIELRHTPTSELRHSQLTDVTPTPHPYTPEWTTTTSCELRPHLMSFATTPILYHGPHRCVMFL